MAVEDVQDAPDPRVPLTGAALGTMYPEVVQRVRAALWRLGVPADELDDAVSEAVLRALVTAVPVRGADDLVAWLVTVGRRVYVDQVRAAASARAYLVPAQRSAAEDTEGDALNRVHLHGVLRAITTLSDDDREALLPTQRGPRPGDRRSAVRAAVRRHRVRARIRRIAGS